MSQAALTIPVRRLDHAGDLPLPAHATAASAGVDLLAAVAAPITLAPGKRALIPTGIALALPAGYEAQVRPRSGLALKYGLTVLNAPGTIDADYRGEVGVILANLGEDAFPIGRGDRVAQLVVAPVTPIAWTAVETLPPGDGAASARGTGGFGSTGHASPSADSTT